MLLSASLQPSSGFPPAPTNTDWTGESAGTLRHTGRAQAPGRPLQGSYSPVGWTETAGFLVNMAAAPLLWTQAGRTPPLPPPAAPPLPPLAPPPLPLSPPAVRSLILTPVCQQSNSG